VGTENQKQGQCSDHSLNAQQLSNLILTNALNLPRFTVDSKVFIKRHALFVERGEIKKVFYPVFPSHKNAEEVLSWIEVEATNVKRDS